MESMEKYTETYGQKFPYSEEDIKQYMMDVRLQITDSEGTLDDQEALKKIEKTKSAGGNTMQSSP